MRPHGSPSFFPIVILLLICTSIVLLAALHWQPLEILSSSPPKKRSAPRPDVWVWANKQTGLYYCPDSKFYGGTETGMYMTQEQALQTGYRPAAQDYCQTLGAWSIRGAGLFLSSPPAEFAQSDASASKGAEAKAQFDLTEKQRAGLQGKPKNKRTLDEYLKLVSSYRRIYLATPHAAEVPAALVQVAELHQEMGRQFDRKYFQSAIDAYQFLLHEYPENRYRQDALFTIGQIQKDDLEQPEMAEKTFQELLKLQSRSPKADEAKGALAEIALAREQAAKPSARKKLAEQNEKQRNLPQVTQIRTWNADQYTRVVIDVDNDVQYQATRVSNPDRVYFDLRKTKLSSTLAGKTLEVQGGFLKTIRVAQNEAGVVRVVLEMDKVKNYSAFLLPNPYRLVVDVFGDAPVTAKSVSLAAEHAKAAEAPAKTERSEAKRSEKAVVRLSKSDSAAVESARSEAMKQAPAPTDKSQSPRTMKTSKSLRETAAPTPLLVTQPTRDGQPSLTRALGLKISRIVIDPGHGGHDTGTVGPTGLMEKDLCLDVALRLGKIIEQRLPGTEVIYTREDDTFVPLENRTAIANQARADLFISIHANSSHDQKAGGVETYYLNFSGSSEAMQVASRENALSQSSVHELQDMIKKIARNEKIEESRELATDIQDSLTKRLQRVNQTLRNRGVRKAPFVVLIGANMPSVLSEVSFLSNPTDEQLLKRPENRQGVAEGLYHGVESYLRNLSSLTYNRVRTESADR
jgi:N-acetylmuramoyl-L-alanine amidase